MNFTDPDWISLREDEDRRAKDAVKLIAAMQELETEETVENAPFTSTPFTKQEQDLYEASFDVRRDGESMYYGWHSKKDWSKMLNMTYDDFNDFLSFYYISDKEYLPEASSDYEVCSVNLITSTVRLINFLKRNYQAIIAYFNATGAYFGEDRFSLENSFLIYDTTPALSWKGHGFRSPQEVEIARALDRAGVLFFPNAGCRVTDELKQRVTREVDFLVVVDGVTGILECDSTAYHDSGRDKVRDANFNRQGVTYIKRYDFKQCLNPDKVVKSFIAGLKRHGSKSKGFH